MNAILLIFESYGGTEFFLIPKCNISPVDGNMLLRAHEGYVEAINYVWNRVVGDPEICSEHSMDNCKWYKHLASGNTPINPTEFGLSITRIYHVVSALILRPATTLTQR